MTEGATILTPGMFPTAPPPPNRLLVFASADDEVAVGEADPQLEIEVFWRGHVPKSSYPLAMQTGSTLGDRLAMAMSERFFFHRALSIVAAGPSTTRRTIDHAFALLESCEWVIGPAAESSFYLVGCRAGAFDASVFRGPDAVMQRVRALENTLAVLPLRETGIAA